jgi:Cys-tRNA(Pro) deacylase
MAKEKIPATQALRMLKQHRVAFQLHSYKYQNRGGTRVSAQELQVDEHQVIKTLVLETDREQPLLMLMHGDREVSLKQLARVLNVKQVNPCPPAKAERLTGYQTGGISPFGTRQALPVYLESSIAQLPSIIINGGRRGLLVEISPGDLVEILSPSLVEVAN